MANVSTEEAGIANGWRRFSLYNEATLASIKYRAIKYFLIYTEDEEINIDIYQYNNIF